MTSLKTKINKDFNNFDNNFKNGLTKEWKQTPKQLQGNVNTKYSYSGLVQENPNTLTTLDPDRNITK